MFSYEKVFKNLWVKLSSKTYVADYSGVVAGHVEAGQFGLQKDSGSYEANKRLKSG